MYGKLWDYESLTPWYVYYSGGWNQGWYDDEESLELKYNMIRKADFQQRYSGEFICETRSYQLSYEGLADVQSVRENTLTENPSKPRLSMAIGVIRLIISTASPRLYAL